MRVVVRSDEGVVGSDGGGRGGCVDGGRGKFFCGARGDGVRLRHRVNITKKCKLGVYTGKLKSSS